MSASHHPPNCDFSRDKDKDECYVIATSGVSKGLNQTDVNEQERLLLQAVLAIEKYLEQIGKPRKLYLLCLRDRYANVPNGLFTSGVDGDYEDGSMHEMAITNNIG